MLADFVILEQGPRKVDPLSLMNLQVSATVIDG